MHDTAPLLAEMAALADAHAEALATPVRAFDIGGVAFDPDHHPALMGVVIGIAVDGQTESLVLPLVRKGESNAR